LALAIDVGGEALSHARAIDVADADFHGLALSSRALAARGESAAACGVAAKLAANKRAPAAARVRALDVLLRVRSDAADDAMLAQLANEQLDDVDRAWCTTLSLRRPADLVSVVAALAPDARLELAPVAARALRFVADPRQAERVLAFASTSHATSDGRAAE